MMKWVVQHLKINAIHHFLENDSIISTKSEKTFDKIQHPDKNSQ